MKHLTLIFLLFSFSASALQNDWDKKASFVMELERGVAFAIGDKGYVGTGQDSADLMHNEFWQYDPATDTWTQVATLPAIGRRNAVAFVVNDKGYVGTGCDAAESVVGNNLKDIWEYNPVGNSWTQKADYPGAFNIGVYFATAFAADSKGYICCGKIGPSSYSTDLWEYKPINNSWTQRASFPNGSRYQLVSLVIDDIAYVGLGTDENAYTNDWWMYHPGTNMWTQKADMPGPDRASASTFTIGPRGFVAFGSDGGFLQDLWEYNPWNDSWSIRAPFPGGDRRNAIAFTIGNKAYAGTGKGSSGIRRNFYEYTPLTPTGENEITSTYSFTVFPNPASSMINVYSGLKEEGKWKITSLDGKQVAMGDAWLESFKVDVTHLTKGLYIIEVVANNGEAYWKNKITVE
jgi:N-acetylneuraminic acid mutarotase